MRRLRRRIETIIEEVNHEIRVDLGLEEPTPELKTIDTLDDTNNLLIVQPVNDEEESSETKAFEKVLDAICEQYEREKAEIWAESEAPETETEILSVQ